MAEIGSRVTENVRRAVKVRDEVVRDVLVALLAEGHVLIEDFPGVGKTALARALARSLDAEYARVQGTADLLPADVIGTNVFNQREARFEFHPGPVFANIVLVDEINRTSPKTQSGLLECMQERRVTVENQTHELARPFLVLATQNPIEYEGTYPLPEAQLDRFSCASADGLPRPGEEADDARRARRRATRSRTWSPVADVAEIARAQAAAAAVHGSEALRRYVVDLCAATRRRLAGRAGREPARRPDAVPRREGARRARGTRPRAARRRPGASRPRCSSTACVLAPGVVRGRPRGGGPRRGRTRSGVLSGGRCAPGPPSPSGSRWSCAPGPFDVPSLFVPGVALVLLRRDRLALGRAWRARSAGVAGHPGRRP